MSQVRLHVESSPTSHLTCEVCIVGAGFAGAALAFSLSRTGVEVVLIDRRPRCPPTFKAEKLEPDQTDLLAVLGLLDLLKTTSTPIKGIEVARAGRVIDYEPIAQRGALYHNMVNTVRAALPATVRSVVGHVTNIDPGADGASVTLAGGNRIAARLVVLATGVLEPLTAQLGLSRREIGAPHSITFGFTLAAPAGRIFPFDGLNYLPERFGEGVDYLTLFRIPEGMRANLFAFTGIKSPFVRSFHDDAAGQLRRLFPRLERVIGPYEVVSKVEARPIDLWVTEAPARAGVVLAGDAFQSVCPSTGSGLSKVLTDVAALATLVPEWLATPGMPATKIEAFYAHPNKQAVDASSLRSAVYRRRLNTDTGPRMRLHRAVKLAQLAWRSRRSVVAQ